MSDKVKPELTSKPWFYEKNGKRIGAFSESEVTALMSDGSIGYGTYVWKMGFPGWIEIENTELKIHFEHLDPPPLKGDQIKNLLVWLLAFSPIIGLFLQFFVSGIMHSNNEYLMETAAKNGDYWYITVILNITLCLWDAKRLKEAGIDTKNFGKWVWLVPIYLFQRSKALNQTKAYFVTWIFLFAISIAVVQ